MTTRTLSLRQPMIISLNHPVCSTANLYELAE